jgi:hypothetical protein
MESQSPAEEPGKRQRGRPPLPPELSGKEGGKRRKRWSGFEAHYSRAHLCQLAYDLGVPPNGQAIQHALNQKRAESTVPGPYKSSQRPSQASFQEYYKRVDEITAAVPKPKRGNPQTRTLSRRHRMTPQRFEEAEYFGTAVFDLKQNILWPVYRAQPSGLLAYRYEIPHAARACKIIIPGCVGDAPPDPMPRPPRKFLRWIASKDSLVSVASGILVYGASIECNWTDLIPWSFDRVLQSLCRVASTAPFATFAHEFVPHVIKVMVADDGPTTCDWKKYIKETLSDYQRTIELGYETGVLVLDGQIGKMEPELVLLQYADKIRRDKLRREMKLYARDVKNPSPVILELFRRIDAAEPHSYF